MSVYETNGYGNSMAANRRILRARLILELMNCFPQAIAEKLGRTIDHYVVVRAAMPRSKEEVAMLNVVAWGDNIDENKVTEVSETHGK